MSDRSIRVVVVVAWAAASAPALMAQDLRSWLGEADSDHFGVSLAAVGDLDGDGKQDVLVGAPLHTTAVHLEGRAYAYSSGSGALLHAWDGESAGDYFGTSVGGIGDVDGDQVADVVVGAYQCSASASLAGRLYIYSGASGALIRTIDGAQAADSLGVAVVGLGDVDGDGVADFAGGAPIACAPGVGQGRVRIYSGATGAVLREFKGANVLSYFGGALARLDDLDGDHVAELVIGSPRESSHGVGSGAAYIYSGASGALLLRVSGVNQDDAFGGALGDFADADGDGKPDLLVGAAGVGGVGEAYVLGSVSGARLSTFVGTSAAGAFGYAVSRTGDLDGDAFEDFAVGAPNDNGNGYVGGRVYVYSGRTGSLIEATEGALPNARLGGALAALGDIDGDGVSDFLTSAWNHLPGGKVTLRSLIGNPPRLASIGSERADYHGGTTETVNGSGFFVFHGQPPTVTFDDVPATSVTVIDSTTLTCTTPAGVPGPVKVAVTTSLGHDEKFDFWRYSPTLLLSAAPRIGTKPTLRLLAQPNDTLLAIFGPAPAVQIPTPPYDFDLAIDPFIAWFIAGAGPGGEFDVPLNIPNKPALVGFEILIQELAGQPLSGPGKQGAWSDALDLIIES